ncbi:MULTISPECIES: glycosyltransferase family 2 protein [unclassified Mesorhizobium]|uniref:glycosyltransferase family 2 protein n=2 Tax=Mesorhizobium TaxID=68287 RepID=UPI000BB00A7E|nr:MULTISPECIES: glycosyltransferase family 2 protein [unclassified Mesorhizobium]TGT60586.1 glycosyltransferase [Mesorhizobium sp. M00.F.Ca.ET.170.01.1.1]AZO10313.1 glycosyltransferase [Mesorhizobium sp. M3A.F.Ca.ET.080.04.2.1]PBB87839.1 glycosyltransferase [Mesorhizobium sp. WSM3876]RWB73691.1 MAG: glycosyltransferase [Mesorhizobium sp.]RWE27136.1 MAG: glycosyltransferase [Mesorhizobium sp.]
MNKVSNAAGRRTPAYSLVIPIFNEEAVLPLLVRRITALLDRLDASGEAIFVDDGSRDTSAIFLRGMVVEEPRFRLIELSRNFGHQIAITAGMDAAAGDAVIVLDGDLQDPPEVVLDLIAKWKEGYEIVYARRVKREGESLFKRMTAKLFYRVLEHMTSVTIPRDVGDFRLVGRKALETFKSMPERDRFVRGMFGWMGFRQTAVPFERPMRAAGETKYPFWKMTRLAVHGIMSFSDKPLRLSLWVGLAIAGVAALLGLYALFSWLFVSGVVHGWTSTVVIISFLSGINLFMTGIIGLYVGGIHAEVKRRPLYVIDRLNGFEEAISAMTNAEASKDRPTATREQRFG